MSKLTAMLLVVLSTLFWGINFHAAKYVVGFMPPLDAAALRFLFSSILLVVLMMSKESLTSVQLALKQQWKTYFSLGLIGIAGFNGLLFIGLQYTTAINGALIMATNPVITVLLSACILKDRIQINQYIGMILSLLGVVLVITQGKWEMLKHFQIATGDWIIMGANLCFALYGVYSRRNLKESKPLITTAMTMVFGTLVLIIGMLFLPSESSWFHQSLLVDAALLHLAIFGTVLAYLFWNSGIIYLGINQTVIFFNLVPVFTVLIAKLLGQPILLPQILGGTLVLLGVFISTSFFLIKMQKLLLGRQ